MEFKIQKRGKSYTPHNTVDLHRVEGLTFPYWSVSLQEIRLQVDIK